MRVLVVRHHEEDEPGLVGEAFEARGAAVKTLLYPPDGRLPEPERVRVDTDHIVILGATASVYEQAPWIRAEIEWLRRLRDLAVPVFGICFGAQLLAVAHGGAVERAPVYELGWVAVEPLGDPDGAPAARVGAGPWFQFHGDRCVLPPTATHLARNEAAVQGFTLGRDLGVQFHPELDRAQLERWFEGGGRTQAQALGKDPDALLEETSEEEPRARRRAADLVDAYLAHAAAHEGNRT